MLGRHVDTHYLHSTPTHTQFAHKLDTPATLGCEVETVDLGSDTLLMHAECRERKKTFVLNLDLLRGINAEQSTWNMLSVGALPATAAVSCARLCVACVRPTLAHHRCTHATAGRAQLTVRKAVNDSWPRLLKSPKRLPNMHVWWAMREKFEASEAATPSRVPPPPAASRPATVQETVSVSVSGDTAAAAAAVTASPSPHARSTTAAVATDDNDEEVIAAEDATPTPLRSASRTADPASAAAAAAAAADEADEAAEAASRADRNSKRRRRSTPSKSATAESAGARRRRLAKEAAKKSPSATPKPVVTPGKAGGAFGLGSSFSTDQLFGQLAGSIESRRYTAYKEDEDEEKATMDKIDAWVRQQKAAVNRALPDEESRALERVRVDEAGRQKRVEVRAAR